MSNSIPEQEVLGCIRKQVKQKPVKSVPSAVMLQYLPQVPPLASLHESISCKLNKSFPL